MIAHGSSSGGWGWSNLWGEMPSDRLPWFVCKKSELNTKSPSGLYVVRKMPSVATHG
jgi:hypothetical protein